MIKLRVWLLAVVVLALAATLVNLNGCSGSGSGSTPPPPPGKIQHVVVIVQENRTPDNLFQDPVLYQQRGADIVQTGVNSLQQQIPLTPIDLGTSGANPQNYDLDHSHTAFESM